MANEHRGRLRALAAGCALAAVTLPAPASVAAQSVGHSSGDSLDLLLRAAEAHHYRGAIPEAHAALAEAEKAARRRVGGPSAVARVWIARTHVFLSQTTATNSGYAGADTAAAAALRFAERSRDPRLMADAADAAGRVLYSRRINLAQGDYELPLAHFRRALELRQAAGDTRGVVESMFRVGLIHERKDEPDQAIALYEEAMRLAGDRYPLERSNLARHLAYQHQGRGELDRALELFTRSLELREQAGFVLTRPSALTSIGDLHRRKGEYDRALDYGRRALAEAERLGASRFVVGALISLGQTQGAAGRSDAALELLRRAETVASGIGYVSGVDRARAEWEELSRRPRVSLGGRWEGALVRGEAVRLLRLTLIERGDSIVAVTETPDHYEDGPDTTSVGRAGHLSLELPGIGEARLVYDTTRQELRGSVDSVEPRILVHLTRVPLPPPRSAPRSMELEIPNGAVTVSGTLLLPSGPGPHPVVVWLPGRGAGEREITPLHTWLVGHGYAVFVHDKRGTGRTGGDERAATVGDLIADAAAVVKHLARHPDVDPRRIGLLSWSAGGWVAPRVANTSPVAFLVMVVGPAESVDSQQIHAYEHILAGSSQKLSAGEIAEAMDHIRTKMRVAFHGRDRAAYLRSMAAMRDRRAGHHVVFPDEVEARDTSWLRRHAIDPTADLHRLRVPLLAIYGEDDRIVPPSVNVPLLRRHLEKAGNQDFTLTVLPAADHGLELTRGFVTVGDPPLQSARWRWSKTSPLLAEVLLDWLETHARPDQRLTR